MTYKEANEILLAGGVLKASNVTYLKLNNSGDLCTYASIACLPEDLAIRHGSIVLLSGVIDVTEEHRCAYDKHICQNLSETISDMLKQAGASLKHSVGGGTVVCIGSHESFIGPTTL